MQSIPTGNGDRFESLSPGLTPEAVLAHMGGEPIPNPLDPAQPFSNPHLEFPFAAPDGRRIEVWLYVTELRTAPDCPRLTWRDRPVVFASGRLVAWSWMGLRDRLEEFGRTADWYRKLRYPPEPSCRRSRR